MPHKHHHGKVSYLESMERRKEFSPEQFIEQIPLQENDSVLDFGAGTGYFTIPIAEKTNGTVYALDHDPEMLEIIRKKATDKKLTRIVTTEEQISSLSLDKKPVDIILASLVLHEVDPLKPLLIEMKNVLKPNGYLVCVELEPKKTTTHAPRLTQEKMVHALEEVGFDIEKKFLPSLSLYVLVARKNEF